MLNVYINHQTVCQYKTGVEPTHKMSDWYVIRTHIRQQTPSSIILA